MKTLFILLRAVIYASAFICLWLVIVLGIGRSGSLATAATAWPASTGAIGVALMIAGGILGLTCIALFVVRGRGTPAPFDPPKRFVAVGPYRYVRNPMYWGGGALLVGLGLYQRSVAILLFCVGWFLLVHLFVVYFEEPVLKTKFGGEYESYCHEVHRWLPGLSARV